MNYYYNYSDKLKIYTNDLKELAEFLVEKKEIRNETDIDLYSAIVFKTGTYNKETGHEKLISEKEYSLFKLAALRRLGILKN